MPAERRAVLLLLALALAGQGARAWLGRPDAAPGSIVLLGADSGGGVAAQRQRSVDVDRPLRPGERIDLDRASVEELARLPRVGRSLARTIVADRAAHGPFGELKGLDRVPGVGAGLLKLIEPHASFSAHPASLPADHSTSSPLSLSINSADSAGFEKLPGIGPYMAGRIIAYRNHHGPFGSVEDLLKVGGLGPATLARVRAMLRAP